MYIYIYIYSLCLDGSDLTVPCTVLKHDSIEQGIGLPLTEFFVNRSIYMSQT